MKQKRPDQRSPEAHGYRRLYKTYRWQQTRARQLRAHPLCANCQKHGRITAATVCDHIDPKNKLSEEMFFTGPFQSLCDAAPWRCHSREKQRQERGRPKVAIGEDGWPLP